MKPSRRAGRHSDAAWDRDLQPLGDGAYEIGRATLTLAGGERVSPRYVVVWKQEDGVWCRRLDIWNMDKA